MKKGHSTLFRETLRKCLANFSTLQVHLQDLPVFLLGVGAADRGMFFGGVGVLSWVVVGTTSAEAWRFTGPVFIT